MNHLCSISINKNSVPGDQSALHPGGIRIGTAAITTRGMNVGDMQQVALFLDRALRIAYVNSTQWCQDIEGIHTCG